MDRVYLFLFHIFRFITLYTPKLIMDFILKSGALFFYFIDKKHRKIAQANLDLAYENRLSQIEKIKIIKGCYKSLVYTLADFFRNQGASKEEILSKVKFKNENFLLNAIKEGKKVIFITAHYGNWELLPLAISAKLTPITAVGRDLDSAVMNEILLKNREQFDMELLSKSGAMKGMIRALKNSRVVGLLVDQNTKDSEGVIIDFFGKKARHSPSAAILAKKFDAVIIPTFISTEDFKTYEIKFYKEIRVENTEDKDRDILNCVQTQANITQKIIEEKPDEWFWLHKRWKNQYAHIYK